MARAPPSGGKSASIRFCRTFEFQVRHDAGDQFFGVADGFRDDLNVHGGLAGRACALAVNAVLADENESVGEHVQRDGELAARLAHHELVLFQFFAALFVDAHLFIVTGLPSLLTAQRTAEAPSRTCDHELRTIFWIKKIFAPSTPLLTLRGECRLRWAR